MAIFKCKMCGGDLNIIEGATVVECEYCGTKQTVPALDNEKKASLFARANRLRFGCEFDKAAGIYESIVAEFPEEAEAYWGLVLCKYGIEYVDDPATAKKIPTCHRSSFESVMDDSNFEMVLEYSDTLSRQIYREEAKQIEVLRKGIIEVSSKEEPYDIFICYKETDEKGDRTLDSVIAQDVYDALCEKGYRVFFSRITLEDKLGQEYEPYIFAALNSAKIMLAFGTDYEYYNAVWVKNEWSRFLQLIEKGEKKTLIPCYKNIDAYDMPKEFAKLQAQDMGKVGAIQDLLRGIEKILDPSAGKEKVVIQQQNNPEQQIIESLVQKSFVFIKEGDYKSASLCLDNLYTYDSQNPMFYIGKVLIEYKCSEIDDLKSVNVSILENENFKNAVKFATDDLKIRFELLGAYTFFNYQNVALKKTLSAKKCEEIANNLNQIDIEKFEKIDADFVKSVEELINKSKEKYEQTTVKNQTVKKSFIKISLISASIISCITIIFSLVYFLIMPYSLYLKGNKAYKANDYEIAMSHFSKIRWFKDVEEKMYDIEQDNIKNHKIGDEINFGVYNINGGIFRGKYAPIKWIVVHRDDNKALLISKQCLTAMCYDNKNKEVIYKDCVLSGWLNDEFYSAAFSEKEKNDIYTYEKTNSKIFILNEAELNQYLKDENFKVAMPTKYAISQGIQVAENGNSCWWLRNNANNAARQFYPVLSTGKIGDSHYATTPFIGVRPAMWVNLNLSEEQLQEYNEKINEKKYSEAIELLNNKSFDSAISKFKELKNYKDSKEMLNKAHYLAGEYNFAKKSYISAVDYFTSILEYSDAKDKANESKYQYCLLSKNNPNATTIIYIKDLVNINYKNSQTLSKKILAWKANVSISVGSLLGIGYAVDFRATLSGGDGGSTTVKFVVTDSRETLSYCSEDLYSSGNTATCQLQNALFDITKDFYTVKVYDGKGNLIGQASGYPK